jgi:hypothetical protein
MSLPPAGALLRTIGVSFFIFPWTRAAALFAAAPVNSDSGRLRASRPTRKRLSRIELLRLLQSLGRLLGFLGCHLASPSVEIAPWGGALLKSLSNLSDAYLVRCCRLLVHRSARRVSEWLGRFELLHLLQSLGRFLRFLGCHFSFLHSEIAPSWALACYMQMTRQLPGETARGSKGCLLT